MRRKLFNLGGSRLRFWLTGVIVAGIISFLIFKVSVLWLRLANMQEYELPVAIQDTGELVDFFHTYKNEHGQWPPPGFVHARSAMFVRSFLDKGTRVDVYRYPAGREAWFYFRDDRVQIFAVHEGITTRPAE